MRQRCYVHDIQHLIHTEMDYKVMILALVVLFIDHKKVVLVIDFFISNIFMSMKILITKNLLLNIKFPTKPKNKFMYKISSQVFVYISCNLHQFIQVTILQIYPNLHKAKANFLLYLHSRYFCDDVIQTVYFILFIISQIRVFVYLYYKKLNNLKTSTNRVILHTLKNVCKKKKTHDRSLEIFLMVTSFYKIVNFW